MKLTIGMAVYDDVEGVWSTVQALRMYHAEAMREVELVIVDNNPTSEQGKSTEDFLGWVKGDVADCRYIPYTEAIGTSSPRNKVFEAAQGEWVMCIDPHIMLVPGALKQFLGFATENLSKHLFAGPIVYDDLHNRDMLFADEWRGEMWGTWARDSRGDPFSPGYTGEAFEIPAMGLGLFACRKDAWLGFNPNFRGFGGEEWYIHTKYRQHGRKCWSLPWLAWHHRFRRPGGPKYPLQRWQKVRNYVIGHTELGLPLDRVHEHFVKSGLLNEQQWAALTREPANPPLADNFQSCGEKQAQAIAEGMAGLAMDTLFVQLKDKPRDLDRHADKIRDLASQARRVTAFVKRREWNVFLAAGRPKESLIVYQTEQGALEPIHAAVKADGKIPSYTTHVGPGADPLLAEPIAETDLLIIDTVHHAERLLAELERHGNRVTQRILLRGTANFGERSEDGKGPGLLAGLRVWMRRHSEWSVIWHTQEQYGMTLVSRDPADKPALPGKLTMALNFAKAIAGHTADGLKTLEPEQLEARLLVCSGCEQRSGERCAVCGCPYEKKSSWRSEDCPLGKWPVQGQEDATSAA